MSQTEVQLIKSSSVVDGDIVGVSASKLTGTLPAVSGANLTNLPAANLTGTLPAISGANLTNLPASGGITMYDVWQYTSDVQGTQSPLSSHWARAGNFFDHTGSGMSESSGVFTFPTTGKYHIWYKINFYTNGSHSQYVGAYLQVTGNNSNYTSRSYGYGNFTDVTGYNYDTASGDIPIDVTDTANIKIRMNAGMQNQSVYVMGNSDSITTGLTFIRLSDT